MVGILLLGAALRFPSLEYSPPGLAPDEASNGYDAYSIALTGRDQHGHFLPSVLAALNDYRMPAFVYIAVPFVSLLGLSVTSVRMTAATCGWLTIPVVYWLGTRMFNRRAGSVAALLLALSPWHIPLSRIGLEHTFTSLAITAAVAMVWKWHTDGHHWHWALAVGGMFGLSIYGHSTMKLLTPLIMAVLGLLLWRESKTYWRQAAAALCTVASVAAPVIINTARMPELMQARYNQVAVFTPGRPLCEGVIEALTNWWIHISPQYLFMHGDSDALRHPKGMGQLYWVQLPLLIIALIGGTTIPKWRQASAVLLSWIILVGVPVALTRLDIPGSGHAGRSAPAAVPWQILTAAGFAWIWDKCRRWRVGFAVLLIAGLAVQAIPYLKYYFTTYPADVALRFDDGMRQVVEEMDIWDDDYEFVAFTDQASWPYLHILFFTRYDPHSLQADLPVRGPELFAPVSRVGKYHIGDVEKMYSEVEHGLFIMPAWMMPGVEPVAVTCRSDGSPAFKIIKK